MAVDYLGQNFYLHGNFAGTTTIGSFTLNANGGSDLFISKFNLQTVSVNQIKDVLIQKIEIFPVPAQGTARFRFHATQFTDLNIQIVDMSGRIVQSIYSGPIPKGKNQFNIKFKQFFTHGFYFIHLNNKEINKILKFEIFN